MNCVTSLYVRDFPKIARSGRSWLIYCGKTGSGKTTQAYLVVDALLNRPKPIYAKIFNYPELVRELSALRFDSDRFERRLAEALDPDLIVFDDFLDVIPKAESFEEQIALTLIKRRYVQRKPLIITTELTPGGLAAALPRHSEALWGRLYEMSGGRISQANENATNYRLDKSREALINA